MRGQGEIIEVINENGYIVSTITEESFGDSITLKLWDVGDRGLKNLTPQYRSYKISRIYTNNKDVVVVIFNDGTKIIKRLCEGDTFNLYTGVALAIAEKVYGSKTQFKKAVDKLVVVQDGN